MTQSTFSAAELTQRAIQRRAVEAVNWGMPVVNFDLMLQAATTAGGGLNQVVSWSRLQDWKNQTLTPNPDVIYLMPFYSTRDAGPMALEIPPADSGTINGTAMDCWQVPLADVGPAGVDKGKGGKYLILPPGHSDPTPDGYIPLPSNTFQGYALLRSILKSGSDADLAQAIAYGKRVKLYPLAQAANPPETVFRDVSDVVFDSAIPYDRRFFQSLDRMVQAEPWLERDKAMIDPLASLGIVKGQPFAPDEATQTIFDDAAQEARDWIAARYEASFTPPFFEGTHWAVPVPQAAIEGQQTDFANPNSYPIDGRAALYSIAFFSAKHLGEGQFYVMAIQDRDGQLFDGSQTYRLTVPANAPVSQYWSATVYDRATHTLLRDVSWVGRSSQTPGIQTNADGSVDVYFGPAAPAGKASNWIPTKAGRPFEVLVRFYGPQPPLFDKSWALPDVERVS